VTLTDARVVTINAAERINHHRRHSTASTVAAGGDEPRPLRRGLTAPANAAVALRLRHIIRSFGGNQAAEGGGWTDGRALRSSARVRDATGTSQRIRGAGRFTGLGWRWSQRRARTAGRALATSAPKAIGREQYSTADDSRTTESLHELLWLGS
jgi:hypothetical protein